MRIFVMSGYQYWGKFSPDDLFDRTTRDIQIGGGETAMLQISKELARRGHEVFVFYDTERSGKYYGMDFLPTSSYVPLAMQMDFDVLISWDNPHIFRYSDRAKARVLAFQLNDPFVGVYDWLTDLYMHPSDWHLKRTAEQCTEISPTKQLAYMTNGIDFGRYILPDIEKVPGRVIYSSSPDRGLHHLLRFWPEIVSLVPEATLHVFYDASKWLAHDAELVKQGVRTITSDRAALLRSQFASLPPSVQLHGGVGQKRLAEEQLRSHVLAYPCDPVRPTEGFSMTILEGITAGCRVVTTDADALGELWSGVPSVSTLSLPVIDKDWVRTIVDALRAEPLKPLYNPKYAWAQIAAAWERELYLCLKAKSLDSTG